MKRIKVNYESSPIRCEICHQVDCFDPQTNKCSRCISINNEASSLRTRKQPFGYGNIGLICGAFCGAFCGLLWERLKCYIPSNIPLSTSSHSSACWVMIGLAVIGAVWGNMIGEGINLLLTRKGHNVNNNLKKTF